MPLTRLAIPLSVVLLCGAFICPSRSGAQPPEESAPTKATGQEDPASAEKPAGEESTKPEGEPLTKPGRLPWEKSDAKRPPLPAKPIASAREFLNSFGIDASQLNNFFHNQPISPGEEEVLYRIFFRLRQITLTNFDRWKEKSVTWSDVATEPDPQRAKIFDVRGRVKKVTRIAVLPEVAEVLEFDHYFQVFMELDDSQHNAIVCARTVPEAWNRSTTLDERASCEGLFLKLGQAEEGKPQFVFAARRMAWYPARSAGDGITADLEWLGKQGMDIGLFDAPRARNQKPIGASEGECFYGLLSMLNRVEPQAFREQAKQAFDLGPLLQDAKSHHGDVVMFKGNARRVQKIMLGKDDRDLRERFGVDHYYQVDAFIPLGDQQVQFSKGPNDPHGPVFTNSFLVTLCVLKVPPELEEGKSIDVQVQLPVVFYKIWEFPSDYVKRFGDWKMQPAPMLLGIEPAVVVQAKPASSPFFNAGLGIVAVVALVGIWIGLWQFSRGDKRFKKEAAKILASQGANVPVDLKNVVVDVKAKE